MIRRGIDIYMGEDILNNDPIEKVKPLLNNMPNMIGNYSVRTFDAPHNVTNCGFLITTPEKERILFVTDTTGVKMKFRNIDCIMSECNYDEAVLLEKLYDNTPSKSHPENHMGLKECSEFCRQNISSCTKQIILIHMSMENINHGKAVEEVRRHTNFENVYEALPGNIYIFDNDNF